MEINKIKALSEGIDDELELLTKELEHRVFRITKLKEEIVRIIKHEKAI